MQDEKVVVLAKQTRPKALERVRRSEQLVCVYREVYCMLMAWDYVGAVAAVGLVLKKHIGYLGARQH